MSSKTSHTMPRFLVPDLGGEGDSAILPADESHHLARVLRLVAGDRVAVFDGKGREFAARIEHADRMRASVRLLGPLDPAPEPRVPFVLVQAVLKGPAMDDIVRDATMVGARAIQPVLTSHVVVKDLKRAVTDRWQRVALASAKQCRRAVVPDVYPTQPFQTWLPSRDHDLRILFVEPAAEWETKPLRQFVGQPPPASGAIIVGPEGGWSHAEIQAAVDAGCVPVTLGGLTLRADAMALAAGTLFRFLWED
jgi:16S rRNA (uracil1498-N3)-methyltransferase